MFDSNASLGRFIETDCNEIPSGPVALVEAFVIPELEILSFVNVICPPIEIISEVISDTSDIFPFE